MHLDLGPALAMKPANERFRFGSVATGTVCSLQSTLGWRRFGFIPPACLLALAGMAMRASLQRMHVAGNEISSPTDDVTQPAKMRRRHASRPPTMLVSPRHPAAASQLMRNYA